MRVLFARWKWCVKAWPGLTGVCTIVLGTRRPLMRCCMVCFVWCAFYVVQVSHVAGSMRRVRASMVDTATSCISRGPRGTYARGLAFVPPTRLQGVVAVALAEAAVEVRRGIHSLMHCESSRVGTCLFCQICTLQRVEIMMAA